MSEKTIHVPERFDFSYHKQFTDQYQSVLSDTNIKEIALDFSKVGYLDSSALGMMVLFQKKAKQMNIKIRIKGARESAKEILQIANFDRLFDIA